MDNRNDDMVPEWQTKQEPQQAQPVVPRQPEPTFGFSPVDGFSAPPAKPHSGLGIASFIMSIIGLVITIGSLAAIFSVVADNLDNLSDMEDSAMIAQLGLGGLGFLFAGILMLVGLILGIVGLVQKNRKKGFAIAGTIINAIVVGFFGISFLVGLVQGLSGY
ncbi:DUF4190 domain-containing protein [Gorillibacterium sp. CAU 1737]|uniref:DUF4190 domain-containing protein n=1 Tax=Gorillibacterium sp. CAU 1737 TaxID=3140362 RepID=UPI0032608C29